MRKTLRDPQGRKKIYIVLGFDRDAIKTSKTPYDVAVWRYEFHPIIPARARVAPFTLHMPGRQIPSAFVSLQNNIVAVGRTTGYFRDAFCAHLVEKHTLWCAISRLGVCKAQVDSSKVVIATIDKPIFVSLNALLALLHCLSPSIPTAYSGYQIDLVDDNDPRFDVSIYYFDPVQLSFSYRAQNLTTYFDPTGFAVNDKITNEPVTIGFGVCSFHSTFLPFWMLLGLYNYDDRFSPIAVWQGVRYGNSFLLVWVFNIYISHFAATARVLMSNSLQSFQSLLPPSS